MNFVYLLEPNSEWLSVEFESKTYPAVQCDPHIIELENRSLLIFDEKDQIMYKGYKFINMFNHRKLGKIYYDCFALLDESIPCTNIDLFLDLFS